MAQHIAGGDGLIGVGAATVEASGAVGVRSRTAITRGYISDEGDIYTSGPSVSTRTGVAFDKEFADRAQVSGSTESDLTISRDGEFLSASTEIKYLNAAKIAGRVGIGVGLVAAGYQEYQDDSSNSRLSGGQKAARVAAAVILEGGGATVGGLVGGRVGGVVGATVGGALGVLCGPFAEVCVPAGVVGGGIVGTVVGGTIGGAVGGWLGDKAKQALFSANPFGWFH